MRSESPKVNISQLAHPVLNFWAYMNGKGEKLRVSVQKNYKDFELVKEVSTDQFQPGWQRFSIDLTPFKDSKYIRVGIEGESVADLHDFMAYDNVAIIDDVTNDLMALSLTADVTEVAAGDDAVLNFTIRNNAATSVNASDYDVVLLKNGKEVNRTKGEDLAPDKATNFLLSDKASVLDSVATVYAARIDYAADKCPGNNTAESDTFKIVMPDYPAPSALSATSGKGQAELSWTAPDLVNRKAQAVTETFDDYQAFIINDVGDWTMYDADLQNTIRITINELFGPLQYDNAGKPMAFQVFQRGRCRYSLQKLGSAFRRPDAGQLQLRFQRRWILQEAERRLGHLARVERYGAEHPLLRQGRYVSRHSGTHGSPLFDHRQGREQFHEDGRNHRRDQRCHLG